MVMAPPPRKKINDLGEKEVGAFNHYRVTFKLGNGYYFIVVKANTEAHAVFLATLEIDKYLLNTSKILYRGVEHVIPAERPEGKYPNDNTPDKKH